MTAFDAIAVTTAELGDAAMANVYLLGVAVQQGIVPVRPERIEEAIALNGVAVEKNVAAFRLGRRDAVTSRRPRRADAGRDGRPAGRAAGRRPRAATSRRGTPGTFIHVIELVRTRDDDELSRAVAVHLHKLMAYKDEYEVARLLLAPETRAAAEAVGGQGAKVQFNLHPPLLRAMGMKRKVRLGRWATPALAVLRSGKRLRGTPLDLFGMTQMRRLERKMVDEYIEALETVIGRYDELGSATCVAIAELPDRVRGYEHLKLRRAQAYRLRTGRAACTSRPTHDPRVASRPSGRSRSLRSGCGSRCSMLWRPPASTVPSPFNARPFVTCWTVATLPCEAPTGSGKTLAFGLPLLERSERGGPRSPRALVLAPTRELARQICDVLVPLARYVDRRVARRSTVVSRSSPRSRRARGVSTSLLPAPDGCST